jgi:membrane-associated phospholipid phosphatase
MQPVRETQPYELHNANHGAVCFAGLWYLTLCLCAKFNVTVPSVHGNDSTWREPSEDGEMLLQGENRATGHPSRHREAAAPPAFLLPLPYVPLGLAIFIAGTRYFDFRNHGFDVLAGAAVGTTTAWFGFRWYHPPLSSQVKAAWGPRSSDQAFHSVAYRE